VVVLRCGAGAPFLFLREAQQRMLLAERTVTLPLTS